MQGSCSKSGGILISSRQLICKIFIYLQPDCREFLFSGCTIGALAHLARALDWQSKGDRFESDMLHKKTP